MTETENVPDRAQRERELYELRAKGLATNQVQKFEDCKHNNDLRVLYTLGK